MRRIMPWVCIALLGLLCLASSARADGAVVRGQVYNGTASATGALSGLTVRLYVFSGDSLQDTLRTATDTQGMFQFDGVRSGSGWSAVAVVDYAGVQYESRTIDLSLGAELNSDVAVYETTSDDSALQVGQGHLIIEMGVGQLEVVEAFFLENAGDRTYVGSEEVVPGRRATARVPLPASATDVSFALPGIAQAMVRTNEGFVDTRPITPGQHQYRLAYALPCPLATFEFARPVAYPTLALDVLIAVPGAEIATGGLESLGTREASGVSYTHLAAQSLDRGSEVRIGLNHLERATPSRPAAVPGTDASPLHLPRNWWVPVMPALAAAVLVAAAAWHLRRRQPEPLLVAPGQVQGAINDEIDGLLAEMAELDECYATGELAGRRYRSKRQIAKGKLLRLLGSLEDAVSDSSGYASRRTGPRTAQAVRPRGGSGRRRPGAQRG